MASFFGGEMEGYGRLPLANISQYFGRTLANSICLLLEDLIKKVESMQNELFWRATKGR